MLNLYQGGYGKTGGMNSKKGGGGGPLCGACAVLTTSSMGLLRSPLLAYHTVIPGGIVTAG